MKRAIVVVCAAAAVGVSACGEDSPAEQFDDASERLEQLEEEQENSESQRSRIEANEEASRARLCEEARRSGMSQEDFQALSEDLERAGSEGYVCPGLP